jgi:hypothetical protein
MAVAAPIMIGVGLLLLWASAGGFGAVRRKLRSYAMGEATVVDAYSQEETDSDGHKVTRHYTVISIRDSLGKQVGPITLQDRRKAGEHYLLLYDPAAPVNERTILNPSLGFTWFGPLFWLFIAVLLIALPVLFYLFG